MSLYGYSNTSTENIDELEDIVNDLSDDVASFNSYISSLSSSNSSKLSINGGSMLGDISMSTHKITSSYVPTNSVDLTNKNYVDMVLSTKITSNSDIDLGTHKIITSYSPTNSVDLTNKNYVDTVSAGKLDKTGGTISSNLSISGNLVVSGSITSSGSNVVNCFIYSSGQASIVTNTTSTLYINSGYSSISYIPYNGTLNNWQELTLFNVTPSQVVTLGHNASTFNGTLNCLWYSLYPYRSVKLLFDSYNLKWVLEQIPSDFLYKFKFVKWFNDSELNMFVNPSFNYLVKVNFANANTNINGVTGIESITNQASGTNWWWSVSSSDCTNYSTANPYNLSATESNKLSGFIYGFTHAMDFSLLNLTIGNYYMLQVYHMVHDTANRYLNITHKNGNSDVITSKTYHTQYYSVGTASNNSPGQITTYVFRADLSTSETFTFTNVNNCQIYAIFVVNLGSYL